MKKLIPFLLGGAIMLGAASCQNPEKTSSAAPDSPTATTQTPDKNTVQADTKDAQSDVRKAQLNADIRANEQRNNAANGGAANRNDDQLKTEVRSKLEANIPGGQLTVDAKDGAVIVGGTVLKKDQLAKIDTLSKQIKGVKSVK
ncbi:MAG: BON domain-containing protein, partial [Nostocaceae cyanobacterium]|nr:BON domain-containing protein [Nostocaceae cyanobacterium]